MESNAAVEMPRSSTSNACGLAIVNQRLDALNIRFTGFYCRLILLTGICWAIHSAEIVLFTFTRHLVATDIDLGYSASEALNSGVLLWLALGVVLFASCADALGRRLVLLLAMTLSLIGLALSAMAQNGFQLIAARILAGIGLCCELPAITVLVQELTPRPIQGRVVALLEAFTGIGGVVGILLAFGLAPKLGWRETYFTLCGSVLYVGVLYFGVPESPRWLASMGRMSEALLVVEMLEQRQGVRPKDDNLKSLETPSATAVDAVPLVTRSDPFTHVMVLGILWATMAMSTFALGVYVPTLISMFGYNIYESWKTVALLSGSQVIGCMWASYVLPSWDRKPLLVRFATLASVTSVVLSYLPWHRMVVIMGSCLVSALLAGTWCCVYAYTFENFDTVVRARGVAYPFAMSCMFAAVAIFFCPYMFNLWLMSVPAITWVFAVLLVATIVGIVVPFGCGSKKTTF